MNTAVNKSTGNPEDIDLLVLAERTLSFFKRYKWLFLIAALVGLAIGYFIYSRLPKVYKSRMILHSFTLSNQDYIQVIDNWNTLLKKKEYDWLSPAFSVDQNVLRKVKEMKAYEIQKVFTAANPNGFYIDVIVTDNSVLDSLQKGILNGVENVEFIKKQLDIKRDNLRTLIDEVGMEIAKLDSTKTRIEAMINDKSGHPSSLFIDISGLNKSLIELNEKWLYYKQDLKLTNAVQVLQGFSRFDKPYGPNLVVWLGLGLIGFMGIAYVYAMYDSVNRKLKARRILYREV